MNADIEKSNKLSVKSDELYKEEDKSYNYNEAIELAGNGWYNIGLMLTLSLTLLSMAMDMFSFSVVVTLSSCDFQLDLAQKSILVSMPFIGPIVMAYTWGYISDTRGRRMALLIGMSGAFVMSTLCAFAPHWIVLAILKLIGTCFCSCAQSGTFALLGESCADRVKGTYMMIMTSFIHLGLVIYFNLAYLIGGLNFSYDLGLITFVPWRFLALVLALPVGLSALCLTFFYESPKFLLNAGRENQALEVLRQISRRNGNKIENYPVKKLVLNEEGNVRRKDVPLLKSMWEQLVPLFKRPLLQKTLLLYYLIYVVFAASSSLYMWLPFLADAFSKNSSPSGNGSLSDMSLCGIIMENSKETDEPVKCTSSVELPIVLAAVATGVTNSSLNFLMSNLASRKKALVICILLAAGMACVATTVTKNTISSLFYLAILWSSLCTGPLFSYYVDLYPTSFRGMAACLGVMVSRMSSVLGINFVGPMILSNCNITFYSLGVLLFSGVVMAFLLPSDRPKKGETGLEG